MIDEVGVNRQTNAQDDSVETKKKKKRGHCSCHAEVVVRGVDAY